MKKLLTRKKIYILMMLFFVMSSFFVVGDVYAATCGDGNKEATEACDDGNIINNDGCNSVCVIESGYTCEVPEVTFDGLSDSDVDGGGNWVADADGLGITETLNTSPGIVNIEPDAMNKLYKLKFGVQTASDDDMIGIALGYNSGEFNNTGGYDYLIYDWKQGSQFYNGNTAFEGTRLGLIQGSSVLSFTDYRHFDSPIGNGATEFTRGSVYGSDGWADNTLYDLDILYTPTSLKIWIDGVLDIDITSSMFPTQFPGGTFPVGGIGFYSISQAQARFEIIPQVTSFCQDICGNGELNPSKEECEDGNLVPNDGCSVECEIEYCRDDAPITDTSKNLSITSLSPTNISGTSSQPNSKVAICFEDTAGSRDIHYTRTDATGNFTYSPNLTLYTPDRINIGVMLHDENDIDIDHHSLMLMR